MNSMQDPQVHKRTSITELLNPIAAGPVDSYSHPNQLPSFGAMFNGMHPHHLPHPAVAYPPPMQSHPTSSTFSLRAASWGHDPEPDVSIRQHNMDPAHCRYSSVSSSHHQMYPDPYARPARPVEDSSNYGMEVPPTWAPPHDAPEHIPYNQHMISYSAERTAIVGDPMAKNYQVQHYDSEMGPFVTQAWQTTERASVRLAARGSLSQSPPVQQRVQAPPPIYYPPNGMYAVPYPPPVPVKRTFDRVEDEQLSQKTKKSKTKSKSAGETGSSRRGYNAKKRSEAAQIAAQNAQFLPTISYTPDKGKEREGQESASLPAPTMRIMTENGAVSGSQVALHPELQFARCMSNRYRSEEFPRCVSCTRRWAGDTCRFQGIRFFLKNDQKAIVGMSFIESQKPDMPTMSFPTKWNVPLQPVHIRRIKRTVAEALLPTLRQEFTHLSTPEIIRRPRESEVRATCDTCMTSIFSSSWMCRLCGREACAECFEQVLELTVDPHGAPDAEVAALQARREKHQHVNPFFLACTRRNEHQASDFSAMSRFDKAELEQAIHDMELLLAESDRDALPPEFDAFQPTSNNSEEVQTDAWSVPPLPAPTDDTSGLLPDNSTINIPGGNEPTVPVPEPSSFVNPPVHDSAQPSVNGHGSVPIHQTQCFSDADLTEDMFRRIWARGEPLVVTDLLPKFRVQWTPEYFSTKYGTQSCLILECQTDQNKRVTVGEFFSWFGRYEGRRDCWKLKDWPPSTDFKTAFPELYDDFSRATPVPNYVRRDGVLNIASHFPANTVAPDLGPKMYNAMASFESQGSKGSTRLHMDMADAINIMLHSAPTPDGRPGSAVWDLYKPDDTWKLRKFLKKKFKGQFQHDPIHSQTLYLDSSSRQELFDEYGVKSHRIYQKPGDAVFIPAGCAHQVCNLADCIKVACDFVSPENIGRCENLTREFREQNQSMAWKEDVLQLRTMMWFAWLSCTRQEQGLDN